MKTNTLNTTQTRRQGTWKRATRTWMTAMLIALFAIAIQIGAVSANGDPPGGGTTPTRGNGGIVMRPNPGGIVIAGGGLTMDPNMPCIGTNQCIKYLQYEAHGTYALFNFFTMQPAIAVVQLSTTAPTKQADGTYSLKGAPIASSAFSPAQVQHAVELDNLDPGTTYYYLINGAKGPTGVDAQEIGSFKTLTRYVTVQINQITVIDDSDTFSAGDLVFNLKVDNSEAMPFPTADMAAFNPQSGSTMQWSSGETKNVGLSVKIAVGDQANVKLEGWDWDSEQPGWLSGIPVIIDQDTGGIAGDRADSGQTFTVTDDEHGNLQPKSFALQTTNMSLKYKATGTLSISYE